MAISFKQLREQNPDFDGYNDKHFLEIISEHAGIPSDELAVMTGYAQPKPVEPEQPKEESSFFTDTAKNTGSSLLDAIVTPARGLLDLTTNNKPTIGQQAEALGNENTVAREMGGAPVRQSVYNQAVANQVSGNVDPNAQGINKRIQDTAAQDIRGQQKRVGIDQAINNEFDAGDPEALDYVKGMASGANQLVSGIGYITELVGADETGKSIREAGDRGAKFWNEKMTQAGQMAAGEQVFLDDKDSITGLRLSDKWGSALLMGAAQSLPSMLAAGGPGALAAKGIQKLASLGLAGGAGATIPLLAGTAAPVTLGANVVARIPTAVGFGAAEGVTAGAINAAGLKTSIEEMSFEELEKSPVFKTLSVQHGPEKARELIAEQASKDVFGKTALATGAIGALTGGGALAQAYQKVTAGSKGGVVSQTLKAAGQEAIQEAPQSGSEAFIENVARKEFLDPSQDTMEGVLSQAATGAAIGGLTGGVFGAGGAIQNRSQRIAAEREKLRGLKPQDAVNAAATVNTEQTQQAVNNIAQAQNVDEAIDAATQAVSQKPVTSRDVWDSLQAKDQLLAEAERVGIPNQPQGDLNASSQEAQEASAEAGILDQTVRGKSSEIVLPDNTSLPVEWSVVDAGELSATMNEDVNQPRDRSRITSDAQIMGIANNPDYRRLSDSPVMDVGAPVLSQEGLIVAGNGRFEGISRSYDGPGGKAYRSALDVDAANKGIDPSSYAHMQRPVLVRKITQSADTRKLAISSNSGGGLQYSGLELSRVDARRMTGLINLDLTDSGDIALTNKNLDKVKGMLTDYTSAEVAAFTDSDGQLSQEGVRRIRNAILFSAYDYSPVLSRMIESTDQDMRNVIGALTKNAGIAARTKNNISQGGIPKELDITNDVLLSIEELSKIKASGATVDQYLSQQSLFDDGINQNGKDIVKFIAENMRSQKRMTAFFNALYEGINSVSISSGNLFDDVPLPTKEDVIKNATAKERGEQSSQEGTEGQQIDGNTQKSSGKSKDPRLIPKSQRNAAVADKKGTYNSNQLSFDFGEFGEQPRGQQSFDFGEQEEVSGQQSLEIDNKQEVTQQSTLEKTKNTGKNIQDFGEKLGGAKKDTWSSYRDKITDSLEQNVVDVPLSKSWPEPDYQKLIENGADSWAVAFMRSLRDEIPTKPTLPFKKRRWAQTVIMMRDVSYGLAMGRLDVNNARSKLEEISSLRNFSGRVDLYQAIGHEKSLKGFTVKVGSYSHFKKEKFNPPKTIWTVDAPAKSGLSNWYGVAAHGDTKEEAIKNFQKILNSNESVEKETKKTRLDIYRLRTENVWSIGKKVSGGKYIRLKTLDSLDVNAAREYLKNNHDELVKILQEKKQIPEWRRENNSPRVGGDHRAGQDVAAETFAETFGFRGVEFGNYVENDRRQQDLNDAYDALMDMAGILNIPAKSISLNGELGLAFGSRGKGGKRAAKAHYEPGKVVINLTKGSGAGSLGHEWFHALDNYFSRNTGNKTSFLTESVDTRNAERDLNFKENEGIRPEIVRAFGFLMKSIGETSLTKRSASLDMLRSKPYWGTRLEMAARAFESYLISKLYDSGQSNDYLANITSESSWPDADGSYPYPLNAEQPVIRAGFDHLFSVIEHKETDKGVALFQDTEEYSPGGNSGASIDDVSMQMALEFDDPGIDGTGQQSFDFGNIDYAKIQQRPGTTEKQREQGRLAFRDFVRHFNRRSEGRIVASSIPKDFKEKAGTTLIGQKIASAGDLAAAAQVLRDPRFETFRIFYVKDNKVIHHSGVTSRMPGSVQVIITKEGEKPADAWNRYTKDIKDTMKRVGADGYYLLHNHPSGNADPSSADISFTKKVQENVPGLIAHVVINSNEYGVLGGQNSLVPQVVKKSLTGGYGKDATIPHRALNKRIGNPQDIAEIGKLVQRKDGFFTAIALNAPLDVVSIAEIPLSILSKSKIYQLSLLRSFARNSGGTSVAIVTDKRNARRFDDAVRKNIVLDVVDTEGNSSPLGSGRQDLFEVGKKRALGVEEKTESLPKTITIDGKERPTTNSEGKAIHPTVEGVKNFWKWFGDSKVVDEQGRPVIMYHGTGSDFDAFNLGKETEAIFVSPNKEFVNSYVKRTSEKVNDPSATPRVMPLYVKSSSLFDGNNKADKDALVDYVKEHYSDGENKIYYEGNNFLGEFSDSKGKDYDSLRNFSDGLQTSRFMTGNWMSLEKPYAQEAIKALGYDAFVVVERQQDNIAVYSPSQIKSAIGNTGNFSDDNSILLSQNNQPSKGIPVEEVEEAISDLRSKWKASNIQVIQSVADLDQFIEPNKVSKITSDTDGLYDPETDTVYIVANNINHSDRAKWVAIHEVVGHGGFRKIGKSVNDNVELVGRNKFVRDLAQSISRRRGEDYNARIHLQEAIAELAAATLNGGTRKLFLQYGIDVPVDAHKRVNGIINRIVEAVRRFLGEIFGQTTNQQIRDLITAMKIATEQGRANGESDEYIRKSLMIERAGYDVVDNFVIPETDEYANNTTGDLGYFPGNSRVPAGPIRVKIGEATGNHRGFGLMHIVDSIKRDPKRLLVKRTRDTAEDTMRGVVATMRSVREVYRDGNVFIFVNPKGKRAFVGKFEDGYYSVITERPHKDDSIKKYGKPLWTGRVLLPVTNQKGTDSSLPLSGDKRSNLVLRGSEETESLSGERAGTDSANEQQGPNSSGIPQAQRQKISVSQKGKLIQLPDKDDGVLMSRSGDINSDTIIVDGVERSTRNSEGKPIHSTAEGVRNFWRWFGDSKVVDGQGRPLVVYHGTNADITEFDTSDKSLRIDIPNNLGENIGAFFAANKNHAKDFGGKVEPVYLNINNPKLFKDQVAFRSYMRDHSGLTPDVRDDEGFIVSEGVFENNMRREIEADGFNGAVIERPGYTKTKKSDLPWYIAFNPNQIKSAIGNQGSFSQDEDGILMSRTASLSQAGVNTEVEPEVDNALPDETKTQAFRRRTQDAMLRFKVVQDWLKKNDVDLTEAANVYQRENISKGKMANKIDDFRRKELQPLIERIAKESKKAKKDGKFDLEDIVTYLEAVHIPEANAKMREIHKDKDATANGITDEQAKKVQADFEAMPNFAEFKALAEEVRNIGAETLEMRLENGLISQEQFDAYKKAYSHWVPLRGNIQPSGFGKGMSSVSKDKRRLGHGLRDNEMILENLVQDREKAIMQVEKNKVGLTVAQFILEAQNDAIGTISKPEKMATIREFSYAVKYKGRTLASYQNKGAADAAVLRIMQGSSDVKVEGESLSNADFKVERTYDPTIVMMAKPTLAENEIQVYVNGHAIRLQLNDPGLARAATNAGIEQVGAILHGARMFNRFLSKAYTAWSPDFLFMNMARDAYSGTLVLTGKKGSLFAAKTMMNYAFSIKELFKSRNDPSQSKWVQRYRDAGGNIGAAYLDDLERVGENAVSALQEFAGARETYRMVYNDKISQGASASKARTVAAMKAGVAKTKAMPVVGHLFKTLENVNAVIENSLRLAAFKTAIESGDSDQEAASLSKDLMNFNRKGEMANKLGAAFLFYNPGMQGIHIVGEALTSSPHKAQVWGLLGGLTALSFMLSEIGRGLDEDEWENIPDHVKDRNMIFHIGDKQVTVPVAYGFGVFHAMGNLLSNYNHGEDPHEISVKLASAMFENFSVFGNPLVKNGEETDIYVSQVFPTLLKMMAGPENNINSLGNQIHPIKYQDSQPDSQNMTRTVRGTIYDDLASLLNDSTGGTKYNPGMVDISPNTIKYWVTSLTGGAGRFVSDIVTGSMDAVAGVAPELENVPVARKFVRNPGVTDARNGFWNAVKESEVATDRFRKAIKDGDVFESQKMLDEKGDIIALAKFAGESKKMSAKYRDAVHEIQINESLTRKEKKLKIKELEAAEQRVYDNFLKIFREAKK